VDDECVAPEIRRAVTRLARRLRGARSPGALSPAKIGVLAHLDRYGASSPGAIAAADGQLPQALTRTFAELTAEGLVSRAPSERDRRGAVLSLTDAGARALAADLGERDTALAAALAELTATELGVLRLAGPILDRLADRVPARGVSAVAG
jgi:DNA-binding MarR family transcriptional regulator